MSRARLGLYVFGRRALFEQCYELQPTFQTLLSKPDKLELNLDEKVRDVARRTTCVAAVCGAGPLLLPILSVDKLPRVSMFSVFRLSALKDCTCYSRRPRDCRLRSISNIRACSHAMTFLQLQQQKVEVSPIKSEYVSTELVFRLLDCDSTKCSAPFVGP